MRIGLDVGNGSIGFVVQEESGNILAHTYASVYAGYDSEVQHLGVGDNKKRPSRVFTLQGRDYVLGYEDVQRAGTVPISAYDRDDRLQRPEFQTLTKLALLDAATKSGDVGVIKVDLSIGTPNDDYRPEKVKTLEKWFKEPVTGAINGQSVVVMVEHIEVLSQPIGALVDAFYDDKGYLADESLDESDTLVIDAGSGTLDMTYFHGTALVKQVSESIGLNDVYQLMIEFIEKSHPKLRVSAYDLEYQLRSQDGAERFEYSYGALTIDVTAFRKTAMDMTWERMVGAVTRRFPDRMQLHNILLAGGTADAFQAYFRSWMPTIKMSKEPQLAVAWGLLKYLLANSVAANEVQ